MNSNSRLNKYFFSEKIFISLLLLAFALPIAYLYTKLYLQSRNTLEYNQHWKTSKVGLKRPINGAVAYHITPVALSKNRLNLGAWFGFQEVLYHDKIQPKEIDFDLLLPEGAYANFIYNKGDDGFSGIRLSRAKAFPSMHFTANAEGKFLQKDNIEIKELQKDWGHVHAVWGNNEISFFLNSQPLGTFKDNFTSQQKVGFRGGAASVSVDNIFIKLKDSKRVIEESFDNSKYFWRYFLKVLALILALDILILSIAWFKSRKNKAQKNFNYVLTLNLLLLLFGLPLYFLNYSYLSNTYVFSKIYFKLLTLKGGYKTSIETKPEVITRLNQEYPETAGDPPYRILFLGSSQTWGAGAYKAEDSFVHQIERKLNDSQKGQYQCINGGISGERSEGLWELYSKDWIKWKPKAVVINLSNNDSNPVVFADNLQIFSEFNQTKRIQTIFSLEANSPEIPNQGLQANHQVMREVARAFNIPIIDLNDCLSKDPDTGFLWWDFVHLTSYGQELAANCLAEPLEKIIKNRSF